MRGHINPGTDLIPRRGDSSSDSFYGAAEEDGWAEERAQENGIEYTHMISLVELQIAARSRNGLTTSHPYVHCSYVLYNSHLSTRSKYPSS
jgi:hypothetical protein